MISNFVLFTVLSLGPFSMPERQQDSPEPLFNQLFVQDYGFPVMERQNNLGVSPKIFVHPALSRNENSVPIFAGTNAELFDKKQRDRYKRQKEKL